jgi:hypothetical protein
VIPRDPTPNPQRFPSGSRTISNGTLHNRAIAPWGVACSGRSTHSPLIGDEARRKRARTAGFWAHTHRATHFLAGRARRQRTAHGTTTMFRSFFAHVPPSFTREHCRPARSHDRPFRGSFAATWQRPLGGWSRKHERNLTISRLFGLNTSGTSPSATGSGARPTRTCCTPPPPLSPCSPTFSPLLPFAFPHSARTLIEVLLGNSAASLRRPAPSVG